MEPTVPAFTGLELKVLRIRQGVKARAVASALGVRSQRVSAIEATYRPSPEAIRRYLEALQLVAEP